jgi:hypothetical protein
MVLKRINLLFLLPFLLPILLEEVKKLAARENKRESKRKLSALATTSGVTAALAAMVPGAPKKKQSKEKLKRKADKKKLKLKAKTEKKKKLGYACKLKRKHTALKHKGGAGKLARRSAQKTELLKLARECHRCLRDLQKQEAQAPAAVLPSAALPVRRSKLGPLQDKAAAALTLQLLQAKGFSQQLLQQQEHLRKLDGATQAQVKAGKAACKKLLTQAEDKHSELKTVIAEAAARQSKQTAQDADDLALRREDHMKKLQAVGDLQKAAAASAAADAGLPAPPAPAPAEDPPALSPGLQTQEELDALKACWVQVSSEDAPGYLWGERGLVASCDARLQQVLATTTTTTTMTTTTTTNYYY